MDQEDSKHDLTSPFIPNTQKGIKINTRESKRWCDLPEEVSSELSKQMKLACPLVVVSLLQYNLQVISVMFIGHLGELSLSSASMATSFAGVTGFSFMLGMGSALETFCGQAYGAKQYNMLGIYMQRAMVVVSIMCIPIALLWTFTCQIFKIFGQDLEISLQAGIYAKWLIPSILPYGLLQCQFRFLQTQNIVNPLITITSLTSLIHLCGCWILVYKIEFGIKGAAFSVAMSYWFNVFVLGVYIKLSPLCKKTWGGLSKESSKDLVNFLSLGVPSALMVCLEFGSYELLVLMSGNLPNPKLETSMMSISLNTISIVYRFAFGFGSAVSTRVSNELGAGRPDTAKLAVQVVLFLAIVEGVVTSLSFISTRGILGYLYSNEKEVVDYISSVIPILAISSFMDGIQGVLSGAARGCGWQKIGAFVNLGAYYFVGIPCAIILTFYYNLGGKGLWMGIISGSCLQGILLLAIIFRTDWEYQRRFRYFKLAAVLNDRRYSIQRSVKEQDPVSSLVSRGPMRWIRY